MIERTLLLDMGFVRGSGWDHEVWVYDGNFWVYYNGEFAGLAEAQIDGSTCDRSTFFKLFLDRIVNTAVEAATYDEARD
jgi:hypothetical protein